MKNESKTTLEYFKQIEDVPREQFVVPVYNTTNKMTSNVYRTGDGDTIQTLRPGALDFLQYKSKGIRA